ncbi:DUF4304 domain-containing protein [Isobaculum melis]|uniref:DUF4304 domain-containing protein n=1 Tax=Isobaculum melis TaxID=142588 RepID=A0A1H9PXZ7_9LACT|nr:DUF4304 domain-containing protein [Isobaculum melis]SER53008.1 protein of unknown function [Isobaculum melis]
MIAIKRPFVVSKKELIKDATLFLKEKGFKKNKNTWLKFDTKVIAGFNIQSSYYDGETYYINVGIIIKGVDKKLITSPSHWHFSQRIDEVRKSTKDILSEGYNWIELHSDLEYLKILCSLDYQERLPIVVYKSVIDYFLEK